MPKTSKPKTATPATPEVATPVSPLMTLLATKVRKELKHGEHKAILTAMSVKPITGADGQLRDALRLDFILPEEDNRPLSDIKSSEKSIAVLISHLRKNQNKQDEDIVPVEFLNNLIKNKTVFSIWTERTKEGYLNISYLPPLKTATAETNEDL